MIQNLGLPPRVAELLAEEGIEDAETLLSYSIEELKGIGIKGTLVSRDQIHSINFASLCSAAYTYAPQNAGGHARALLHRIRDGQVFSPPRPSLRPRIALNSTTKPENRSLIPTPVPRSRSGHLLSTTALNSADRTSDLPVPQYSTGVPVSYNL